MTLAPHRVTDLQLTQLQETGQIKLYGPTRVMDICDALFTLGIDIRDVLLSVEGPAILLTVALTVKRP